MKQQYERRVQTVTVTADEKLQQTLVAWREDIAREVENKVKVIQRKAAYASGSIENLVRSVVNHWWLMNYGRVYVL